MDDILKDFPICQTTKNAFDESLSSNRNVSSLSEDRREFLHFKYGELKDLPVDSSINPTQSPHASLLNAANYMFHLEDKGFVKLPPVNRADPLSIYTQQMRKASLKTSSPIKELSTTRKNIETIKGDPEYRQLMTMHVITEQRALIEKLPFRYDNDRLVWAEKFVSEVSKVAREFVSNGDFNCKKKQPRQLLKSTIEFYKQVVICMKKTVEQIYQNKIVLFSRISPSLKEKIGVPVPDFSLQERDSSIDSLSSSYDSGITIKRTPVKTKNQKRGIPTPQTTKRESAIKNISLRPSYRSIIAETPKAAKNNEETLPSIAKDKLVFLKNDVDDKIFGDNADMFRQLPAAYRPTRFYTTEKSKKNFHKKMENDIKNATRSSLDKAFSSKKSEDVHIAPPIKRPSTSISPNQLRINIPKKVCRFVANKTQRTPKPEPIVSPPIEKVDIASIHNKYWEMDDPLPMRTTRIMEPKKQFEAITNFDEFNVSYKSMEENPNMGDDVNISIASIPSESEIINNFSREPSTAKFVQSYFKPTKSDDNFANSATANDLIPSGKYEVVGQNRDALMYLLTMPYDKETNPIHDRLEQIWDQIGFGIMDKLNMVLKYSNDAQESVKLTDALDVWEEALNTIDTYNRAYRSLKDFLKLDQTVIVGKKRDAVISDLKKDLTQCEQSIHNIAEVLKNSYGDDLIIKRHKADDLIQIRRQNIRMLLENHKI